MPVDHYFNRPTHMAFHDLTTRLKPPANLRSLLGLCLKFIPTPRYNTPWSVFRDHSLPRFDRSLRLKAFFAHRHNGTDLIDDPAAFANLPDIEDDYNPRLHVPSDWYPPDGCRHPAQLVERFARFSLALRALVHKKRSRPNLLPHQRRALQHLRAQRDFLVINCDKNLGPAIIERDEYIKLVIRDHLSDADTYRRLSPVEADIVAKAIVRLFDDWYRLRAKDLTKEECTFLSYHRAHYTSVFSTFYATAKVHKAALSTRPIVSTSGTLLYALGVWCDSKLQLAAQRQRSYFKNSFALKKELDGITLPPNARLFTADAVSMYTNIPTNLALRKITAYLNEHHFPGVPIQALMTALALVMKYNVFTFGDTTWRQRTGTAMGTPPAPPWANLYFAVFENSFLPDFDDDLILYRRFIDDVFGIFLYDPARPDRFADLTAALNHPSSRLTWTVEPLSDTVDFMDLTITIDGARLRTRLFEKVHNLHLYIPPHSCHSPGLLPGMVHGQVFRIFTLCSDRADQTSATRAFFRHLQLRGYSADKIRPLFKAAIRRALHYTGPCNKRFKASQMARSVLFHLRFHPLNPPSSELQRLWNRYICRPPMPQRPLWKFRNYRFKKIEVDRMIVAYSRPPNLSNLLSYRRLRDDSGPPASSFFD